MSNANERAITFDCTGERLMGVLHRPSAPRVYDNVFVFVVGGPQYRVGSHRMFVELARSLAKAGAWVLRFDCRGMGDSDGVFRSFEDLDDDIRAAIDVALSESKCLRVTLLGLCDGASACAMYTARDARVRQLVLINPWVRTTTGEAAARMTSYYPRRVRQFQFWRQLLLGRVHIVASIRSLLSSWRASLRTTETANSYIERMFASLIKFTGVITIVLSEKDLVAQEFVGLAKSEPLSVIVASTHVHQVLIEGADHTFSGDGQLSRLSHHVASALESLVTPEAPTTISKGGRWQHT